MNDDSQNKENYADANNKFEINKEELLDAMAQE